MPDPQRIGTDQRIAHRHGAAAPVDILGQTGPERADGVKHRAPGDQVGGDRKAVAFNIAAIVKAEHRLERLGPAARRGGFVKHIHRTADDIALGGHLGGSGQPVGGGYTIGIQKTQARCRRLGHAPVARGSGTFLRLGHETDRRMRRDHRIKRAVRAIVDNDDLGPADIALQQRRKATRQPGDIVVMRDDDGGSRHWGGHGGGLVSERGWGGLLSDAGRGVLSFCVLA